MKVFNLYKKLFRKYIAMISIYVVIFLGISVIIAITNSESDVILENNKINVSLVNYDDGSVLSDGLIRYLEKFVNFEETDPKDIQDALYFRSIYSYIRIPENFEKDFLNFENTKIIQERIEENANVIVIDLAINKFLNYVRIYLESTNGDLEEVINLVYNVLEQEISIISLKKESNQLISSGFYFKTLSYIITAVVITVIGFITISFRKTDVRNRFLVSPYSQRKANLEMIFGNFLFSFVIMILFCLVSLVLYPKVMLNLNGLLLILNGFSFSIAILCLAYFLSLMINKEQVLAGVNNIFSLGTAFLAGAFVPQSLLSKGILRFAHILPNYYYVYNVDLVTSNDVLAGMEIQKVIIFCFIQICFACLFALLSLVLGKRQSKMRA